MFKKKDIKTTSKILGVDETIVKNAISTATAVLKKQSVSTYSVCRAFKIMLDQIEKNKVKEKTKITYPLFNFKHKAIKLYRSDIMDLYFENEINENYGYGSISTDLKDKYNITVSRSTIKLYIEQFLEYQYV